MFGAFLAPNKVFALKFMHAMPLYIPDSRDFPWYENIQLLWKVRICFELGSIQLPHYGF